MRKKSKPKTDHRTKNDTSVDDVTRDIKWPVKLVLAVRAGGRCEFDGCNDYLFEHHVTLREGFFGQNAHIVAFKTSGPRGNSKARPKDIHSVENLMLLCNKCHKQIDDHPQDFTKEMLERQKNDHEARIKYLTGIRPDRKTAVLQFKAKVREQQVDIPNVDIATAVAPRYPISKKGFLIDLSALDATGTHFIEMAKQEIDRKVSAFYNSGGEIEQSQHVSLFAIGPIPLLAYLGGRLSDKIPVDLFQRHRATQGWQWNDEQSHASYETKKIQLGSDNAKVAVILSLSGKIPIQSLPRKITKTFSVFEITLKGQNPHTDFLRTRLDLDSFRAEYRRLLATLVQEHPKATSIHLFPAIPVPIAVSLGLDRLRQVHPEIIVYNNDGPRKGFVATLRID